MPAQEASHGDEQRQALDRVAIQDLIHRERRARDMKLYDELASWYHPDSEVDISWIKATGAEFARRSIEHGKKLASFHEVGAMVIDLDGDRALADVSVVVHLIADLDGVEVDDVCYVRLRFRAERRAGRWLLSGFRVIYMYDELVPTDPTRAPRLDGEVLKGYRASYRYLSYVLAARDLPVRDDLPGIDRPETVERLLAGENAWLRRERA